MTLVAYVRAFAGRQFWGGHPNTFRTFFAWASLSIAYYFYTEAAAFSAHGYEFMRLVAPSAMWGVAFAVHWFCISAIVLTYRRPTGGAMRGARPTVGVGVQLFVNCYGTFVWSMYVVLQDMAFGHFAINASAERVMVIYSVWALVRTGMGRRSDGR